MVYTPKPDREVKDGKAVVSAKELAAFKSQYGEDKSLRDLLNMDKGLRRKGEGSAPAAIKVPTRAEAASSGDEMPKHAANYKPPAPFKPKSTSELSSAERKKRDDMESSQALESSHPELLLNPGRAILSAVARPLESADKLRSAVTTGVNAVKNSAPARALRESQFTRAAAKDADEIAAVERARAAARTTKDLEKKMPEFNESPMKRGGAVKKMASGGSVSASRRGDGIATKGKTRGKIC